jgi:hypothetical protein
VASGRPGSGGRTSSRRPGERASRAPSHSTRK